MKRIALKVDPKGRVQIPKQVRDELGMKNEVSATIEDGIVKLEPIENILSRLSKNVRFNFKSVKTDLPKLRKAAERELLKEI